jgi:hypothetical protein
MIILDPEGNAPSAAVTIAGIPRLTGLKGKTMGILDNSKPNADNLAKRLGELLMERYGVADVISRRKLTAQQGAPKQYLEDLAAQADFVLCGLGD